MRKGNPAPSTPHTGHKDGAVFKPWRVLFIPVCRLWGNKNGSVGDITRECTSCSDQQHNRARFNVILIRIHVCTILQILLCIQWLKHCRFLTTVNHSDDNCHHRWEPTGIPYSNTVTICGPVVQSAMHYSRLHLSGATHHSFVHTLHRL